LKPILTNKNRYILAATSGLLLTLAFPRTGISQLAWFALIPLLAAINDSPRGSGFRIGFLFGMIHNLSLLYWLVYTMRVYGYLPYYLCIPLFFLFSAFLSLYTGLFTAVFAQLRPRPLICLITAPALWVGLEYIRSFFLSGFPWELLGYSQYKAHTIIQMADIAGVYGISFLLVFVNTALFLAIWSVTGRTWNQVSISRKTAIIAVCSAGFIFLSVLVYGIYRLDAVHRLSTAAPKKRISAVQGNIRQVTKWDRDFRLSTIEKYIRMSRDAAYQEPDLIVWPETATPFYYGRNKTLSAFIEREIRHNGVYFLIGSPRVESADSQRLYFNSAYLIDPQGKIADKYDKIHLVPFGEYVPFKKYLPFLGKIVEHVGDFQTGKKGDIIQWGDVALGMQICYEGIFPELSRAMAKNGANILINITNDAWYGKTSAPFQHFSMAVFRAVENRRALVRTANTGISGFIDPAGQQNRLYPPGGYFPHILLGNHPYLLYFEKIEIGPENGYTWVSRVIPAWEKTTYIIISPGGVIMSFEIQQAFKTLHAKLEQIEGYL
jgi:apolipoprotein N-acyltransferase